MISIIIPVLNEEKIIEQTIISLSSKLTIPYEIIVSDGKSTDKTVGIAKRFATKVVEYTDLPRQTIAQGRNDGAKVASGDFLVFLDADCSIENPDAFFIHALKHFENPSFVGLAAWLKVLPENATFADRFFSYCVSLSFYILTNIFHIGSSSGEFQMFRADSFRKIHGYNEHLVTAEDLDILRRISKIGKISLDSDLIVYHTGRRVHKVGWPKLLSLWFISTVTMIFGKKSAITEWEVIR